MGTEARPLPLKGSHQSYGGLGNTEDPCSFWSLQHHHQLMARAARRQATTRIPCPALERCPQQTRA